ncbi:MAG: hypothetical protein B6I36_09890, partial [Desulfobacteraceae bacterium 4572_35.1]
SSCFNNNGYAPVVVETTASSGAVYGLDIHHSGYDPDDHTSLFLKCYDNANDRMVVYSDGDIKNHDNSYGGLSDITLKENIRPCTSKLNDLLNVKVRHYNFKGYDKVKDKHIGVVSQELEKVFPGLVYTGHDGYKVVQYSLFVPMLIKAIQELNLKVEKINERTTTTNDDRRSSDGSGANAVAHYDA